MCDVLPSKSHWTLILGAYKGKLDMSSVNLCKTSLCAILLKAKWKQDKFFIIVYMCPVYYSFSCGLKQPSCSLVLL